MRRLPTSAPDNWSAALSLLAEVMRKKLTGLDTGGEVGGGGGGAIDSPGCRRRQVPVSPSSACCLSVGSNGYLSFPPVLIASVSTWVPCFHNNLRFDFMIHLFFSLRGVLSSVSSLLSTFSLLIFHFSLIVRRIGVCKQSSSACKPF